MYFKLIKIKYAMLLLMTSITVTILIQTNCLKSTNYSSYELIKKKSTSAVELNFNLYENRADFSRNFRIFDFIFVADWNVNNTNGFRVTLASQSSFDRLFSLIELAEMWQGPISLAVYAMAEEIQFLILFIVHLRKCFQSVKNFVNFHLMIAFDDFKYLQFFEHTNTFSLPNQCGNSKKFFDNLEKNIPVNIRRDRKKKPYPQNHLRNIARKNIQTSYMFLIDIDIVPNKNMAMQLNDFFVNNQQETQAKIAYVIPTFEMDRSRKFPETKTELMNEIDRKFARPFHQKTFVYNQFATNFSQWFACRKTETIIVSHFVSNYEFFYEPFYVARDSVPVHDERFYGYGYTRNSQVYEMYLAGWKFAVLSPVFTIHWGLQTRTNRFAWREKQNYFNGLLFRRVKQELLARYNRSSKF